MMKKPILITGGCGFVGRHLVRRLLNDGESVFLIDNLFTGKHPNTWLGQEWKQKKCNKQCVEYINQNQQHITFIYADILTLLIEQVKGISKINLPDFKDVFHLASIVGGRELIDGDPLLISTDLAIDSSLFLWATRFPKKLERLMYASSSAAYPVDLQTKTTALALKEEFIQLTGQMGRPDMTYGWAKLTGEYLATLAHKKYGLHVACVRPFSGYGEDQDLSYPVPAIGARIARHDNPIEVWGTGEQGRDFVYIDDCIDAMLVILDKINDGRGINIGSGKLTSFNELIKIMCKLEGYDAKIKQLLDKPVGVQSRYADKTILSNTIGWSVKTSIDNGMLKVLEYAHKKITHK